MMTAVLQHLLEEMPADAEVEAFLLVGDGTFTIPIVAVALLDGRVTLFGEQDMAQATMKRLFLDVVEEAKKHGELQDLLIAGLDGNKPKMTIGKKEYVLGLVDSKPMLLSTDDSRELLDPVIAASQVSGLKWDLEPVKTETEAVS